MIVDQTQTGLWDMMEISLITVPCGLGNWISLSSSSVWIIMDHNVSRRGFKRH